MTSWQRQATEKHRFFRRRYSRQLSIRYPPAPNAVTVSKE
jgi:hypothetical protein